jgi:hypothetical protein
LAALALLFPAAGAMQAKQPLAMAVIVHPKNPLRDVSEHELKGYLRLDRQFWPGRKRVQLYLPPSESPAKRAMNDKIYGMDETKLRKYWVSKVFAGDIPAMPQVVKNAEAAGRLVADSEGAVSVVPADEVPPGVRVLAIDGKQPGDEGYLLLGEPAP